MIIKREPLTSDHLRQQLDEYERQYERPSDDLTNAFRVEGRLRETEDFRRWSMLFTAWKRSAPQAV